VLLVGLHNPRADICERGALPFEIASQMDEVAVELEFLKCEIVAAPIERIRIVKLTGFQKFLPHENERHSGRGEGDHRS